MIFSAALIALPFVASVFAKDCTRTYTVQPGDICDSISAAKNVSTYQLSAVNSAINDDCTNLVPGSQLCLGYTGEDCSQTYIVRSGDTCEQVASNHGLNTTILYANNPNIDEDCENIYVGEVLCVAGGVAAPPTPSGHIPGSNIPTTAAPANPSATKHTGTSSANTSTHTASSNSNASTNNGNTSNNNSDDDDDEDLPYCDEL